MRPPLESTTSCTFASILPTSATLVTPLSTSLILSPSSTSHVIATTNTGTSSLPHHTMTACSLLYRNVHESNKRAEISYATIQGSDCLIQKFRNSSVMLEDPSYRPKVSPFIYLSCLRTDYHSSSSPIPIIVPVTTRTSLRLIISPR